jgi:septal ring factor EnvC (AmiA/AmiB activator)
LQEKSETFRVSAEAAELHSLLQTGKFERQALQDSIGQLRSENSALARKVSELDARNDDQERTLASVLARDQVEGPITPGVAESSLPGDPTRSSLLRQLS